MDMKPKLRYEYQLHPFCPGIWGKGSNLQDWQLAQTNKHIVLLLIVVLEGGFGKATSLVIPSFMSTLQLHFDPQCAKLGISSASVKGKGSDRKTWTIVHSLKINNN